MLGNARFGGGGLKYFDDLLIGSNCLGAAAKDACIAGLQTKSGGIDGDIGARLIDDADDAERNFNSTDFKPVGSGGIDVGDADGIGQFGGLTESFRHIGNTLLIEREPVDVRRASAFGFCGFNIERICKENFSAARFESLRHFEQRLILDTRRHVCEFHSCLLGGSGFTHNLILYNLHFAHSVHSIC